MEIEQDPGYCQVSGKAKHGSARDAIRAVKSMSRGKMSNGQAYKCPHCNSYHHCSVSKDQLGVRKLKRQRKFF